MTRITWASGRAVVPSARIRRALRTALVRGGRKGLDVDVIFVRGGDLTRLHGALLGDPSPTDVISLPLGREGGGPDGEIYVSVDQARRVARDRGLSFERELVLYVVHGALHLCGLDDRDRRKRTAMRATERSVLGQLGYSDEPV
jgi:probable rRNA maturation factor